MIIKENVDSYELETLLGILNSKLGTFYHFNSSPKATKGAFPKILVYDIKNFPLPNTIENEHPQYLVKKILELKNQNPPTETKELEKEIDQMVYELYGLTEEEIKIVEESTK